jgi:glycosyltransferase involved in cell wall biosynthesis
MKLLYLTQVFEIEEDTGSDRHSYFCRYAAREHGWRVVAITSNVDYKRAMPRYPRRWFVEREYDGITIHYVYSFAGIRGSFLKRFWYYVTYFAATVLDALRIRRPDVIYAVSTPLSVGFLGFVLSRLWRRPYVFEVTDLWPDALLALGVAKKGPALLIARWMERTCYRGASRIVALTEGIREGIVAKGIAAEKVTLITNGFDPDLFRSVDADAREKIRKSIGLATDELCCMYLGAHGLYNALPTIIEAAEALRDRPDISFVLLGDGDAKAGLKRMAHERDLKNVRFLDPLPRRQAIDFLTAADVLLIPNRAGEFFRMNLPNKLFDFLATGHPIVVAGEGETAEVVRRAACGIIVPAEDSLAMSRAIVELLEIGEGGRLALGERGRDYAMKYYTRDGLAERFVQCVTSAVQ